MTDHKVELLAPAGKWDVLERVVTAGADAVYLGGKRFNMRALRSDFNFSEQELKDAVNYLHQRDKKLYVTVNNSYYDDEIGDIKNYLVFLQEIGVDALIVQDFGIVNLHHQLGLSIPLHASVQMGVASSKAVNFLAGHGFTRVILSKNVSLVEIKDIYQTSNLCIEYFAHGDLCISHAGQCYMSSFAAGESGNRGRCIKPCRWQYSLQGVEGKFDSPAYLLAHNDLCLYSYLEELIDAGVYSFKIEGRMRSGEYLSRIIRAYRKALDEITANPTSYTTDQEQLIELQEHRVRDFTTGNLFTRPGIESIGLTGEREPFFPTTAFKLSRLNTDDYVDSSLVSGEISELTVKVGNPESFKRIYTSGVDNIIIGCESIRQINGGWNKKSLAEAIDIAADSQVNIFLETPRIVTQQDMQNLPEILHLKNREKLDGIIVNDIGSLNLVKQSGITVRTGYGLNINNFAAAEFFQENGVDRITTSLELENSNLRSILACGLEVEVMVHGPLCGMISDYCLARSKSEEQKCTVYCRDGKYALKDAYEQIYLIRTDTNCRNYIFYPYDLCLFAQIPQLAAAGLKYIRIDAQYYDPDVVLDLILIYQNALHDLKNGQWNQKDNFCKLLEIFPRGLTSAPLIRKQDQ
ncbi:MAG: U32 family peptidase [Syntrophomonadaceae bacterium]|nr:U32 family peptidase [Syntrophomonadaceae bacterium]MDD3888984.1 U32 family peptidase [Syntrophomonadaceae bacterium]MDD4549721.1 U32 family peptidase [Syntrophomonadaceae bacterium]